MISNEKNTKTEKINSEIKELNDELQTETIPNKRVYLQAFRVDKKYQGQGLGQKLIEYCIENLTSN